MKKIRLRADRGTMNTPYGVITHEWTNVPDDTYLYQEMEVFGEEQKPAAEPVPQPTIPQPVVIEPVKKKRKK